MQLNQFLYEAVSLLNIFHDLEDSVPTYIGLLDLKWTKSICLASYRPGSVQLLCLFFVFFFFNNWKRCQKNGSFKCDSFVVTVCFLIAGWWDANITVTLHTVTTSKVGCNPSDSKAIISANSSCTAAQGICWPLMCWVLFQPWHLLLTLAKF